MKIFILTFFFISSLVLSQTNKEIHVFAIVKKGEHLLRIHRKYINRKKDTVLRNEVQIPFWKFKK
jgi:small-conductance mechanosensitive channel